MTDGKLLKKINDLINNKAVVAYDSHGNALTGTEYKKQLDKVITEMEDGTDEGLTTEEVSKNILIK